MSKHMFSMDSMSALTDFTLPEWRKKRADTSLRHKEVGSSTNTAAGKSLLSDARTWKPSSSSVGHTNFHDDDDSESETS